MPVRTWQADVIFKLFGFTVNNKGGCYCASQVRPSENKSKFSSESFIVKLMTQVICSCSSLPRAPLLKGARMEI